MTTDNIATALAAFHADLPAVGKDATNPHFGSKYADLADIVKVVLPALAKQGLAWIATPRLTEDGFVLSYELRHTSGESIKGEWPLPDPTQATPQALGSAVTYAKRYTLSAVTGIAPDTDDDGNAASTDGAPRAAGRRPQQPKVNVDAALEAINTAPDAAALDKLQDLARQRGIDGVAPVKAAIAARRAEVGESTTDAWEAAPVPA